MAPSHCLPPRIVTLLIPSACCGATPLLSAAEHGLIHYHGVARHLLGDMGADMMATNWEGWTTLHVIATARGFPEAVRALITEFGAAVDATDIFGNTPLHLAARFRCRENVNALIDCGAIIDARNIEGWAPLHFATHNGREDIV